MYKENLALNNLQWLICHKIKPDQTKTKYILPRVEHGRRSIFKRSTAHLNLEFPFFETNCQIMAKESNFPIIYP